MVLLLSVDWVFLIIRVGRGIGYFVFFCFCFYPSVNKGALKMNVKFKTKVVITVW